jgi:hypothetical protein
MQNWILNYSDCFLLFVFDFMHNRSLSVFITALRDTVCLSVLHTVNYDMTISCLFWKTLYDDIVRSILSILHTVYYDRYHLPCEEVISILRASFLLFYFSQTNIYKWQHINTVWWIWWTCRHHCICIQCT